MQDLPAQPPNESPNDVERRSDAHAELPVRIQAQLQANDARWAQFRDLPFEQWPDREKLELDLSNRSFRPRSEDLSAAQVAAAIDLAAGRPWFANLHKLSLCQTPIAADVLAEFGDCRELRDLFLAELPLRDEALAIFSGCTRLAMLALRGMRLSRRGLGHFASCHELRSLDFFGTPIYDKGLAIFSGRALEKLNLTNTRITDKGLATLARSGDSCITGLKELSLMGTHVTDEGMRLFNGCVDLERLTAVGCWRVTSDGLDWLWKCKNLFTLFLGGTQIDDRTLHWVKDCPRLWEVCFSSTEITARGLLEFLEAQKVHHYLVECEAYGCPSLPELKTCQPESLIRQLREWLGSGS